MADLFITTLRVRPLRREVAEAHAVEFDGSRALVEVTCYGQTVAVVDAELARQFNAAPHYEPILWLHEDLAEALKRAARLDKEIKERLRKHVRDLVSDATFLMAATRDAGLTKLPV